MLITLNALSLVLLQIQPIDDSIIVRAPRIQVVGPLTPAVRNLFIVSLSQDLLLQELVDTKIKRINPVKSKNRYEEQVKIMKSIDDRITEILRIDPSMFDDAMKMYLLRSRGRPIPQPSD